MNRRNSNTQLLEELEALSQSLYQTNTSTTRRTASLALPRTSLPSLTSGDDGVTGTAKVDDRTTAKPRSRRMSLSPWRSWPKLNDNEDNKPRGRQAKASDQMDNEKLEEKAVLSEKKGIWNWKPIRALSHIGMQKLSCLFSVEVVSVQSLPASMNGLRLSVGVRKKESKDGAVHTMPSRVSQGAADFEETLFIRCHVYCTSEKQLKFEPRPFWVYVFAVDAEELDFGRSLVDLSLMIQESMEKNSQGIRVRQWDTSFNLSGKAKGGELVLKLGFQIMEKEGGIDIYSQSDGVNSSKKNLSLSFGRKQSKTSFSVPSPRMSSRAEAWTPSQKKAAAELRGIDDLNLDEPAQTPPSTSAVKNSGDTEAKMEDLDLPDFEVVDKGVEIQDKEEIGDKESIENIEVKSSTSEVVKEMVHDHLHLARLTELHSIAQQIKALESMMGEEKIVKADYDSESQRLDAEEETVTREFLQMLEYEEANRFELNQPEIPHLKLDDTSQAESNVYLPDLGKGLGCVVQTRDGGYLASMNPFDTVVSRKATPKLAMQLSKPFVIPSHQSMSGFELFQRMAAIGFEELSSKIFSLMPMEELIGKTAEQIAFEGIASAIIHGRKKEGASSSAARTIAAVKTMSSAMTTGRKDRVQTGLWNVDETPLPADELLGFSLQKIEMMALEALKIEAEMVDEDAPFDVSPLGGKTEHPLASAIPLDDWVRKFGLVSSDGEPGDPSTTTIALIVQLRDPMRRYESVGGPFIALIHATQAENKDEEYEKEKKFKVTSFHIGGLKLRSGGKQKNTSDTERQRLTAVQWLIAYGLGKGGKKGKQAQAKGQDLLWSISSRIMADMWLKPMRNPDVKFSK